LTKKKKLYKTNAEGYIIGYDSSENEEPKEPIK